MNDAKEPTNVEGTEEPKVEGRNYKEELEKERNRKGFQSRKGITPSNDEPKEDTPEDVDIEALVEQKVNERLKSKQEEDAASKEENILSNLIEDEDKRELVKFYLENKIKRTGTDESSISEDINMALTLVDSKKVKATLEEVEYAKQQKEKVSGVPSSYGSSTKGETYEKSPLDQARDAGFSQGDINFMVMRKWSKDQIIKAIKNKK